MEKIGKSTSTIVLDGEGDHTGRLHHQRQQLLQAARYRQGGGDNVDFDNSTVLVKTTSDYSGDEDTNSGNSGNTGSNTTPTKPVMVSSSGWGVGMSPVGAMAPRKPARPEIHFTGIDCRVIYKNTQRKNGRGRSRRYCLKSARFVMKKSDFYFDLPERLIAQHPLEQRDVNLMVLDRTFR